MRAFDQSPTDPAFVQDPYPFYDRLRVAGDLAFWSDYGMPVAAGHATVAALLRDKRFGREDPFPPDRPDHQRAFWSVEDHSLLQLEPPAHTRLRAQVLRAFTSARIARLEPEIAALADALIDAFPSGPFDLLDAFARPLPVRVIARLLGVPEDDGPDLLRWSNDMVRMYMAARTVEAERGAAAAAAEFADYLERVIAAKRTAPADDLLTRLLEVEADGVLTRPETVATCILLLNAGHEATVHTLGNATLALHRTGLLGRPIDAPLVEEVMRIDPPLHMFTRYATEDVEVFGHRFARGDQVGLLLGAANRDPAVYPDPATLRPDRFPDAPAHLGFGGGIHFCLGAALARMEIRVGLDALVRRCPDLTISTRTSYADVYHFHGLDTLHVDRSRDARATLAPVGDLT
ncbi:cytochrome P450 [Jannaschia sp. LMIT008]|uniref:cytochrome P450 n=1 Tax=Jannaschia maritima TaxID=3032585 RepID=UPI0028110442|nr:cytochrome P450 [Jannaschia sp. LMIT008]